MFLTTVPIDIKRLHNDAVIPKYQTVDAAGFDFHSVEDMSIEKGQTVLVKTGLAVALPRGFELQVRPRSGLSLKTGLRVANSPGTVDADYRGEICVILSNTSDTFYSIKKGDRIAQGVICPIYQANFVEVEELNETERGTGAFGSTGKA